MLVHTGIFLFYLARNNNLKRLLSGSDYVFNIHMTLYTERILRVSLSFRPRIHLFGSAQRIQDFVEGSPIIIDIMFYKSKFCKFNEIVFISYYSIK